MTKMNKFARLSHSFINLAMQLKKLLLYLENIYILPINISFNG